MKFSSAKSFHRVLAAAVAVFALAAFAFPDSIPQGWEASNMKPIGYSNLEGHGGFKMAIRHVNNHWYLYMGHLWMHGWSIVDVTNPEDPKLVKTIPGPDDTWTIQMDIHDHYMLTALQKQPVPWGSKPDAHYDEGMLVWDISDPVNPKQIAHWKTGSEGTHRNIWPEGKYAYVSAVMPGYKEDILVILDMSDPANPKEAGRWWWPGQKEGETPMGQVNGFHGPVEVVGNKAYLGYGPHAVILDISDIAHPKMIGHLDYGPPFKTGLTAGHDAMLIPGKQVMFVHSEGSGGDTPTMAPTCSAPLDFAGMVDIKDETKPRLMSILPLPVPPAGQPYTDFCDKGGRFGPHNVNIEQHLPDVEKQANLIYLTYFNAGLRIYDVEDPRLPKEVGWFIPPTPTERIGPIPAQLVTQTEDVLVDTRGNIYITDKQWGLFVLKYTGKGEPAPTAK